MTIELGPTATSERWSQTPRGRRELAYCGVFVLLSVGVPLWTMECYPFSRAPMFADAPVRYCEYRVFDPKGKSLELLDFGLQRNYWGNPLGVGCGYQPPASLDTFGEVADEQTVRKWIQARLQNLPDLLYVEVEQHVIGAVEEGVGVVSFQRWRIERGKQTP